MNNQINSETKVVWDETKNTYRTTWGDTGIKIHEAIQELKIFEAIRELEKIQKSKKWYQFWK
jgi:hypothetical protein